MRLSTRFFAVSLCLFIGVSALAADVTFESLVKEMTDLNALASFPDPAYTCKQFSSYDQRSTDPAILTDENWFANGDRGQHLRKETRNGADEWVMADMEGPGAVVRIWSANANDAGVVRVYLDGQAEPTIEMPLQDMLNGENAPYLSPISGVRSKGWNTHLPIPYAKHCKITCSKPDFYYQINYRTYESDVKVETYKSEMANKYEVLLAKTVETLAKPDTLIYSLAQPYVANNYGEMIGAGGDAEMRLESEGAIRAITCTVTADDVELAVRKCVLEITFDDAPKPSVQAPLGDFFGTAPGINPFKSLPCGVTDNNEMYSYWVMPYKKSATLRIVNHGDESVRVTGQIKTAPRKWDKDSMYFHAKWRAEYDIPTQPRQDWTYVEVKGKGRFVGDMLHITNPVKQWWGEGDEKIYVDNEKFPSHFGTGTEDYYGYAWCFNIPFTHAYHNQPRCDGPGNYGHTCVSRYHILDNIPFTKAFKFDMEVWHWKECEVHMAATSFWYARPKSKDSFEEINPDDLKIVTPPPILPAKKVEGAIEGEAMKTLSVSGGDVTTQFSDGWNWSGDNQLWWTGSAPGDTLALAFNVDKASVYDVRAVFTKAVDYGIMQLYVNGEKAGEPMDFYNDGVVATEEASIGSFDLKKGQNVLKVEVVGANPKSQPKRHMFGLDYLLLKPVAGK